MKTYYGLFSINRAFVRASTHRQVEASPSHCYRGAAALSSVTLTWLKAELVLLRMETQRSHHADGTKPQRPLRVIREAQGVRFAPKGAFVLCLHQGMGMQSALCRITPCSRTTASGLIIRSQEDVHIWEQSLLNFFLGGIFHYLHPLLSSESSEIPFASLILSVMLALFLFFPFSSFKLGAEHEI